MIIPYVKKVVNVECLLKTIATTHLIVMKFIHRDERTA